MAAGKSLVVCCCYCASNAVEVNACGRLLCQQQLEEKMAADFKIQRNVHVYDQTMVKCSQIVLNQLILLMFVHFI